jgi:T5SS/PEP-CTERM-associated repeat protein
MGLNSPHRRAARGIRRHRRFALITSAVTACAALATPGSRASAAQINWNNPAGGAYDLGSNWGGGIAPGANDAAVFDLAGQSYVVTLASGISQDQLRIGAGSVTLDLQTGLFGDYSLTSTAAPSFVIGLSAAAPADPPAALTLRGKRAFTKSGVIGYAAGSKGLLTIDGSASLSQEMIMDGTLDVGADGSGKLILNNGAILGGINGNVGTGASAGRVELSGYRPNSISRSLWALGGNLNVGALGEIVASDSSTVEVNGFTTIAGSVTLSNTAGLRVQQDLTISGAMTMQDASHLFLQGALKMSPGGTLTINNSSISVGNMLASVKNISDDGGSVILQKGLLRVTDGITFGAGRAMGNNVTLGHGAQLLTPGILTVESGATVTMNDIADERPGPAITASRLIIAPGGTFNFNLGRLEFTDYTFDVAVKSGGLFGSALNLASYPQRFTMAGNLSIGDTPGAGGAAGGSASIGSGNSITAATLSVGANAGEFGTIGVAGEGTLNIRGTTIVGDAGKGELSNEGGALVGFGSTFDGNLVLGKQSTGEGTYTTAGGYITIDGTLLVGDGGKGTLIINGEAGGVESAYDGEPIEAYIGKRLDSQGIANISGGGWTHWGGLTVGQSSGAGSGLLSITGGFVNLRDDFGMGRVLTIRSTGAVVINGGALRAKRIELAAGGSFTYTSGSLELLESDLTIGGPIVSDSVNLTAGEVLGILGTTTIDPGKSITLNGGRFYTTTLVADPGGIVYNSGALEIGQGAFDVGPGGLLGSKLVIAGAESSVRVSALNITDTGATDDPLVGVIEVSDGGSLVAESIDVGQFALLTLTDAQVNANAMTIAANGTVFGRGTLGTNGLTNAGTLQLSGGSSDIFGPITNTASGKIIISDESTANFVDPISTVGGSEISVSAGSTAVFLGGVNGAGAFTGSGMKVFAGEGPCTVSAISTGVGSTVIDSSARVTAGQVREDSLSVDGRLIIAPNGTSSGTSKVNTLSITGVVDLYDNKLIVTAGEIGSLDDGVYSGVTGLVQSGRFGGSWDGNGIITSMPDAVLQRTTLAVVSAGEALSLGATQTTLWGGQMVSGTDTLVMYTYAGDLNVDGVINADDYAYIDLYSQIPGASGYTHGDINYDGAINADDYALIDLNSINAGPPFETRPGVGATVSLVAVPEPGFGLVATAASLLLARRRRRSRR